MKVTLIDMPNRITLHNKVFNVIIFFITVEIKECIDLIEFSGQSQYLLCT